MILVLASRDDPTARFLIARWAAHGVGLLTVQDFSVSGWRFSVGDVTAGVAVIGGRRVSVREITGVHTRLPWVDERELTHIAPADRRFVASEMNAFLIAWLSELPCCVLNPPTAQSFAGPNWRPEQWASAAAGLGLAVQPVHRWIGSAPCVCVPTYQGQVVTVTMVGDRSFGSRDPSVLDLSCQLARAAGVELLAVQFGVRDHRIEFLGADCRPEISSPEIADAIADYLLAV